MISSFFAAIKTVAKRMAADWLILISAFVTIALATSLLAAGPIYADAVTISALQRTLDDAPPAESNITVNVSVFPRNYATADEVARSVLTDAVSPVGTEIFAHVEAEAFGFQDQQENGEAIQLASFQYFQDIADHATLTDGRWPETTSGVFETAVLDGAAISLGLTIGDRVEVENRRDPTIQLSVEVVGIYTPTEPSDPFWFEDDLALGGTRSTGAFTTYGPFVLTADVMFSQFTRSRIGAGWRALPFFANLTVDQVDLLRSNVSRLDFDLDRTFTRAMGGEVDGSSPFAVVTGLDVLLNDVDRSLTVTRASVLALVVQLAILAGYALVLMAGLVTDTRRVETTLVRSRGASPTQILGVSLVESVLLVAPAVVVGPYLATVLLGVLNTAGPLADIGLTIDPAVSTEGFVLAVVAGVLAVVALTFPAYRSAREFTGSKKSKRQLTKTAGQRFGVDLALLAVAFVVFWQLEAIGSQISARVGGQFGVDPLLIVAPALGLLAGAVLALRIVPLLARGAEWLASAGKSTVSALASWQVARRPVRYARSSLLLMMAIGIGFFAAAYGSTWATSQRDQSAYEIGSDVAVVPNRSAAAITDLQLRTAHEAIEGVEVSMPVEQQLGPVSRSGGLGRFMIVDSSTAAEVVNLREDLANDFPTLMRRLEDGRPELGGFLLPGEPSRLGLTFEAIEELPPEPWPAGCDADPEFQFCEEPFPLFQGRLRAIVQDGNDQIHRLDMDWIPANEGPTRLTADLTFRTLQGELIEPVYPLKLVSIEIRSHLNEFESRSVELRFGGISVFDSGWVDLRDGSQWGEWLIETVPAVGTFTQPSIETDGTTADGQLKMNIETGTGFAVAPAYFSMRVIGTELPESFPIVVTEMFLESNEAAIGDELRLPSLGVANDNAVIVGTVKAFPTVDSDQADAIVIDLPTLQMMGYQADKTIRNANQYWISTNGQDTGVAQGLSRPPVASFRIETTSSEATSRASDPVALGTIGALAVGFVAAAVFASVGFAVSATVSARERLVEFSLLRALGLSPRQLAAWLFIEQGALVIVSLALGTLIGFVLTATILPLVTLTQDGSTAFPPITVEYPWATILTLEAAVVVVLGIIVTLVTVALRRVGLGGLLRMGED